MSLTVEFHLPAEHEEAYDNDKVGNMITQLDARKFLIAFLNAGLIDKIDEDLEIIIEGRHDIPEGRMTVFVNGFTINFEVTNSNFPSPG